jgi:hypothetical protein
MNANKSLTFVSISVHSWFGVPELVFKPKAFLLLIGGFGGFSLSLKSTFCLPSWADPGAGRMPKGVLRRFRRPLSSMALIGPVFIEGVFSHA